MKRVECDYRHPVANNSRADPIQTDRDGEETLLRACLVVAIFTMPTNQSHGGREHGWMTGRRHAHPPARMHAPSPCRCGEAPSCLQRRSGQDRQFHGCSWWRARETALGTALDASAITMSGMCLPPRHCRLVT